jgi:hypothetical protein
MVVQRHVVFDHWERIHGILVTLFVQRKYIQKDVIINKQFVSVLFTVRLPHAKNELFRLS